MLLLDFLQIAHESQILNATMDQVKRNFCKRVMHILHNRIIEEKNQINTDQTNVYFDYTPETTLYGQCERTISVQLGGF